jgi:LCP family protein required for cell wall assembly
MSEQFHLSSRLASQGERSLDRRVDLIRLRRSLSLLVMTLLAPGSAQLVAGSRRVGRMALATWLALVAVGVVVAVGGLIDRSWLLTLGTNPTLLLIVRLVLPVLAVAWVLLLSDAWRLGDPLRLRRPHRAATVGLNTALCMVTAGALLFSAHLVAVQRDFILTVFNASASSGPHDGRYNVLLLGGDSGEGRWGLRPDSINIASIDEQTGRTILFSLPRNMESVPFAEGSVMDEQFPDGFDCDGCYLNGVYTWALDHEELWPRDVADVGVQATKEAVEGITGLRINYYAMVNMAGFKDLVDAVGGVEVDVEKRITMGAIGKDVEGYIEPGLQRLDGHQALWYARSRVDDDDYARMARQKCVMTAMLHQLSPSNVVLKVQDIASAGKRLLTTDIPASELDTFIELALKARSRPVSSVSFVPPKVLTYDPDFEVVRDMVDVALAKAEGTIEPSVTEAPRKRKSPDARNSSDDLASSC